MRKIKVRYSILSVLLIAITATIISCSQESNSLISRAYHNTTAHFNAYYLAKTRMYEMEEGLVLNEEFDFNRIVEIYAQWDTNYAKSVQGDLDYIYDKAAIPTVRHKNSKWVDNCNILLAKTRFYACKNDSAALMFKYVNTHGTDDKDRHEALILLMRTYLRDKLLRYAYEVKSYLEKEKLTNVNYHEYQLACAEYARVDNSDYRTMLVHMEEAIKYARAGTKLRANNLTRYHFIAGQLHQRFGNDKEAYQHYKIALKRTPPYEFEFYAKLNMAQCSPINDAQELKKINKYFKRILAEDKNSEFEDRIYYEEALFEYKQGNINKAVLFLNKSIQSTNAHQIQNAYSYLKLGEIYYDEDFPQMRNTEKFRTSKLYYDSSVTNLSDRVERYDEIVERKQVLTNFVDQLTIIETEDSLQMMASLTDEQREAKINQAIELEKARLIREEENRKIREKKAKQRALLDQQNQNNPNQSLNANASFPFYNTNLMYESKKKFESTWGERILEDNWRRSQKEFEIIDDEPQEETQENLDTLTSSSAIESKNDSTSNKSKEIIVNRDQFYDDIPFSEAAIDESNSKLREAYFKLGKIYDQDLEKPEQAIKTFLTLVDRFPNHENYVEVLYNLYLLCEHSEQCNQQIYATEILTDYSNSIYARLVENPNYGIDNFEANKVVRDLYEAAYNTYKKGYYIQANQEVNRILNEYPLTDIKDKLVLLKILTLAKTDQFDQYEKELNQFKLDFPTSPIVPYVDELLLNQKNLSQEATFLVKDTTFTFTPDTTHLLILHCSESQYSHQDAMAIFHEFNSIYFKTIDFSIRRMELDTNNYIISIKEFTNQSEAKTYLDKLNHFIEFRDHLKNIKYEIFTISFSNYRILQRKKNLDGYRKFYRKEYPQ